MAASRSEMKKTTGGLFFSSEPTSEKKSKVSDKQPSFGLTDPNKILLNDEFSLAKDPEKLLMAISNKAYSRYPSCVTQIHFENNKVIFEYELYTDDNDKNEYGYHVKSYRFETKSADELELINQVLSGKTSPYDALMMYASLKNKGSSLQQLHLFCNSQLFKRDSIGFFFQMGIGYNSLPAASPKKIISDAISIELDKHLGKLRIDTVDMFATQEDQTHTNTIRLRNGFFVLRYEDDKELLDLLDRVPPGGGKCPSTVIAVSIGNDSITVEYEIYHPAQNTSGYEITEKKLVVDSLEAITLVRDVLAGNTTPRDAYLRYAKSSDKVSCDIEDFYDDPRNKDLGIFLWTAPWYTHRLSMTPVPMVMPDISDAITKFIECKKMTTTETEHESSGLCMR